MTAILRVSLAVMASVSVAAYGQSTGGPVHPGTTVLDAMGIVAGAAVQPVHPGTAILDSMGIFAGIPAPYAPNGNAVAVTTVIPK
jgi:hypothetical protein